MAAPEPSSGVNFFLPWGLVEWAIGGLAAFAGSIALWVWGLGNRVDRIEAENVRLREEKVRLEGRMEKLDAAISSLKDYLVNELRDLPSRGFIESQVQQLSERMDGMIDAKIVRRVAPR